MVTIAISKMTNRRCAVIGYCCTRQLRKTLLILFVVGACVTSPDGTKRSRSGSGPSIGFACALAQRNTQRAISHSRNSRYDTSLQSRLKASFQAADLLIPQRPIKQKGRFWNAIRSFARLTKTVPSSNEALLSTATLAPPSIEANRGSAIDTDGYSGVLVEEDVATSELKDKLKKKAGNLEGRALLLLAALCLGTLNTTIRMVYSIPVNGKPINPWMLSVIRSWMATVCFAPLWWASTRKQKQQQLSLESPTSETTSSSSHPPIWKAALELTVWNFGSRALWNLGLVTTPSARASFLIQLSVVMTPLISVLAGKTVPSTILLASALALSGLSLVSGLSVSLWNNFVGKKMATAAAAASSFGGGDVLILIGTLCWSLYMSRLSHVGNRYEGIKLQGLKTILLSTMYSIWYGGTLLVGSAASAATTAAAATAKTGFLSALLAISPMIWILLFYTALGPGTVAAIAQHRGQSKVSTASEANVILSMESVFAALTGLVVLGEVPTPPEAVGGGMILLAAIIATRQ